MSLVFWNELAEQPLAVHSSEARRRMDQCVDVLGALLRVVGASRLRSHAELYKLELASGYTIATWEHETDQVRRLLFRKLQSSSPLLREPEDSNDALDRYGCTECWHKNQSARGLRAAWASDELSVSLDTHEDWHGPYLTVEVEILDDKDVIVRRPDVVRHVGAVPHVEAHRAWLKARQLHTVRDGRELWDRRAELFPNLDLCRETRQQLAAFDSGSPALRNVVQRLLAIDAAFSRWDGNPIHPDFLPSKCTPETPQTLAEEAAEHTATRADGSSHLFMWHARFTPHGGRIFFDGDAAARRGLVGYIGFKKDNKLT